eukprot:5526364-Ditylum_brightwellii.AAC.1
MHDEVLKSLQYKPPWNEIDNEDKAMQSLLLCNKLHLHQAWDTPFANGPLKDYLGTDRLGQRAQDIRDGEFNPNKADSIPAINH